MEKPQKLDRSCREKMFHLIDHLKTHTIEEECADDDDDNTLCISNILEKVAVVEGDKLHKTKAAQTFPWTRKLHTLCTSALVSSNALLLQNLMKICFSFATKDVETCLKKPIRASRLCLLLRRLMIAFWHIYKDLEQSKFETEPLYEDLMAGLVSLYLDLELKSSKRQKEAASEVASRITLITATVLGFSPQHIIDAIIQAELVKPSYKHICYPFLSKYLKRIPLGSFTNEMYMKYILAMKIWREMAPSKKAKHNVLNLATECLSPPKDFCKWYRKRQSSLLPPLSDKKESTKFLVKADFSVGAALMAMYDTQKVRKEDTVVTSNTKKGEGSSIFFMDPVGDMSLRVESADSENEPDEELLHSISSSMVKLDSVKELKKLTSREKVGTVEGSVPQPELKKNKKQKGHKTALISGKKVKQSVQEDSICAVVGNESEVTPDKINHEDRKAALVAHKIMKQTVKGNIDVWKEMFDSVAKSKQKIVKHKQKKKALLSSENVSESVETHGDDNVGEEVIPQLAPKKIKMCGQNWTVSARGQNPLRSADSSTWDQVHSSVSKTAVKNIKRKQKKSALVSRTVTDKNTSNLNPVLNEVVVARDKLSTSNCNKIMKKRKLIKKLENPSHPVGKKVKLKRTGADVETSRKAADLTMKQSIKQKLVTGESLKNKKKRMKLVTGNKNIANVETTTMGQSRKEEMVRGSNRKKTETGDADVSDKLTTDNSVKIMKKRKLLTKPEIPSHSLIRVEADEGMSAEETDPATEQKVLKGDDVKKKKKRKNKMTKDEDILAAKTAETNKNDKGNDRKQEKNTLTENENTQAETAQELSIMKSDDVKKSKTKERVTENENIEAVAQRLKKSKKLLKETHEKITDIELQSLDEHSVKTLREGGKGSNVWEHVTDESTSENVIMFSERKDGVEKRQDETVEEQLLYDNSAAKRRKEINLYESSYSSVGVEMFEEDLEDSEDGEREERANQKEAEKVTRETLSGNSESDSDIFIIDSSSDIELIAETPGALKNSDACTFSKGIIEMLKKHTVNEVEKNPELNNPTRIQQPNKPCSMSQESGTQSAGGETENSSKSHLKTANKETDLSAATEDVAQSHSAGDTSELSLLQSDITKISHPEKQGSTDGYLSDTSDSEACIMLDTEGLNVLFHTAEEAVNEEQSVQGGNAGDGLQPLPAQVVDKFGSPLTEVIHQKPRNDKQHVETLECSLEKETVSADEEEVDSHVTEAAQITGISDHKQTSSRSLHGVEADEMNIPGSKFSPEKLHSSPEKHPRMSHMRLSIGKKDSLTKSDPIRVLKEKVVSSHDRCISSKQMAEVKDSSPHKSHASTLPEVDSLSDLQASATFREKRSSRGTSLNEPQNYSPQKSASSEKKALMQSGFQSKSPQATREPPDSSLFGSNPEREKKCPVDANVDIKKSYPLASVDQNIISDSGCQLEQKTDETLIKSRVSSSGKVTSKKLATSEDEGSPKLCSRKFSKEMDSSEIKISPDLSAGDTSRELTALIVERVSRLPNSDKSRKLSSLEAETLPESPNRNTPKGSIASDTEKSPKPPTRDAVRKQTSSKDEKSPETPRRTLRKLPVSEAKRSPEMPSRDASKALISSDIKRTSRTPNRSTPKKMPVSEIKTAPKLPMKVAVSEAEGLMKTPRREMLRKQATLETEISPRRDILRKWTSSECGLCQKSSTRDISRELEISVDEKSPEKHSRRMSEKWASLEAETSPRKYILRKRAFSECGLSSKSSTRDTSRELEISVDEKSPGKHSRRTSEKQASSECGLSPESPTRGTSKELEISVAERSPEMHSRKTSEKEGSLEAETSPYRERLRKRTSSGSGLSSEAPDNHKSEELAISEARRSPEMFTRGTSRKRASSETEISPKTSDIGSSGKLTASQVEKSPIALGRNRSAAVTVTERSLTLPGKYLDAASKKTGISSLKTSSIAAYKKKMQTSRTYNLRKRVLEMKQ